MTDAPQSETSEVFSPLNESLYPEADAEFLRMCVDSIKENEKELSEEQINRANFSFLEKIKNKTITMKPRIEGLSTEAWRHMTEEDRQHHFDIVRSREGLIDHEVDTLEKIGSKEQGIVNNNTLMDDTVITDDYAVRLKDERDEALSLLEEITHCRFYLLYAPRNITDKVEKLLRVNGLVNK